MFAQFPDFGFSEGVLQIVRIIASIGGAVVGWFLLDPLTRVGYRLVYHAATPGALLFCTKATAAAALSLSIYFFMPLGGSGGGFGSGAGPGGGPGKGPGQGSDKTVAAKDQNADRKEPKSTEAIKTAGQREMIDIEILGGARFPDDAKERYYLVKKADPALKLGDSPLSLADLEKPLADNRAKIQLRILHTDDSTVINTANDPTRRLRHLANKFEIPTQGPKE